MDKHSDSDVRTFEASLRTLGRMAPENYKNIVEDHRDSEQRTSQATDHASA